MTLALIFAAGVFSCALADGAPAPSANARPETVDSMAPAPQAAANPSDIPWWERFSEAQLSELITRALRQNADVQAAALRIVQAQTSTWQQLAPTLPVLRFQALGNGAPTDSLGFQFGGIPRGPNAAVLPDIYYTGSGFLTAQTTIDLGRSVTAWTASRKDAEATAHDADALTTSLALQIAQTYFDLQTAHAQVNLLRDQFQTNQALLSLTELRFAQGTADGLDVLQQKQQVAAASTRIPSARAQTQVLEQTLRVLVGESPSGGVVVLPEALPKLPALPTIDMNELEKRIPELRAANARIVAATDRVLSAKLAFLPSLGLSGQVGQQGIAIDDVNSQTVWGIGASVSLPLLEGGRRWSAWQSAEAALASAKAQQKQLVLRTQQIIENAVARDEALLEQTLAAMEQARAAADAMRLAQERYAAGLSNYQALLLAVNASQSAQLVLLDTQRQSVQARLQVFNAIGGAWSASLATSSSGRTP